MDEKGVYAIARAIWDDPDFADAEYSQREAWMWLIGAAAWKEVRIRGNGGPITLKRGEFAFSVRFLAERFGWSKSRVERFISALKNRDTIRDTSRDGSTVYSVKNYNDFQVVGLKKRDTNRDSDRDTTGTAAGQQRDKEETLETLNIKTPEERGAPAGAVSKPKVVEPLPTIPDWIDREAWGAWMDVRRRKHAPLTPRVVNLAIGKLERWRAKGHDPTAILDASTCSAWTDIYEPKAQGNGRQKPPSSHDKFNAGTAQYLESLGFSVSGGEGEGGRPANGPGDPLLPPRLLAGSGGANDR